MIAEELMEQIIEMSGSHCPTCTKFVKVYHRPFNHCMAYSLIHIYLQARKTNNKWVHVGKFLTKKTGNRSGDYGKLVWWGLIQKRSGKSKDGNSAGFYRMTRKGSLFVKRRITIPSYAHEYRSKVRYFDGDEIYIDEALQKEFNYNELMND